MERLVSLWSELGTLTKLGLVAQAATCGLLLGALHRPSRTLVAAALFAAILGFCGLSLMGIGEVEYTICGTLDPPSWCSELSPGR